MTAAFDLSPLLDRLAGPVGLKLSLALLHFLWQGVLIAAATALLMRLVGRRSANRRYAIGVSGLALMAVTPVVTFCLVTPPAAPRVSLEEVPSIADLQFEIDRLDALLADMDVGWVEQGEAHRGGAGEAGEEERRGIAFVPPSPDPPSPELTWPERLRLWQPYALLLWLAGTGLFALRLGVGVRASWTFGRGRRSLPDAWLATVAQVAGRLGVKTPRVFLSDRVAEAVAVGLLRPMVLLPAAWLGRVPPDVLEAVLAHELAHLRRYDLWVNLLQRCVEAALFYHPAVWWLSRRVRVEREYCCDETAALAVSGRAAYARALEFVATERVAAARPTAFGTALAAGMGGDKMALLDRVRRVLKADGKPPRGNWISEGLLALAVPAALWAGIATVGPAIAQADETEEDALIDRGESAEREDDVRDALRELREEVKALREEFEDLRSGEPNVAYGPIRYEVQPALGATGGSSTRADREQPSHRTGGKPPVPPGREHDDPFRSPAADEAGSTERPSPPEGFGGELSDWLKMGKGLVRIEVTPTESGERMAVLHFRDPESGDAHTINTPLERLPRALILALPDAERAMRELPPPHAYFEEKDRRGKAQQARSGSPAVDGPAPGYIGGKPPVPPVAGERPQSGASAEIAVLFEDYQRAVRARDEAARLAASEAAVGLAHSHKRLVEAQRQLDRIRAEIERRAPGAAGGATSSEAPTEGPLTVAVYPVADLIASGPQVTKPVTGMLDTLVNLITGSIRPDSWEDAGGRGRIEKDERAMSLIIVQTKDVHEEIADLLQGLRALQHGTEEPGSSPSSAYGPIRPGAAPDHVGEKPPVPSAPDSSPVRDLQNELEQLRKELDERREELDERRTEQESAERLERLREYARRVEQSFAKGHPEVAEARNRLLAAEREAEIRADRKAMFDRLRERFPDLPEEELRRQIDGFLEREKEAEGPELPEQLEAAREQIASLRRELEKAKQAQEATLEELRLKEAARREAERQAEDRRADEAAEEKREADEEAREAIGRRKTTQFRFVGPAGMEIGRLGPEGMPEETIIAPARQNLPRDATYRLRLLNIPGREGLALFPTLQVYPSDPETDDYLSHNSIPIEITAADLDQVESNNFVTKVIYRPNPAFRDLAVSDVETLVSTRLDPGVDPLAEAWRRGTVLAVLRIGRIPSSDGRVIPTIDLRDHRESDQADDPPKTPEAAVAPKLPAVGASASR